MFFRTYLFDLESDYILVADETVKPKSGKNTYGLSRFFSSIHGKAIPSLSFLAMSIVSVKERRFYPIAIEQIIRADTSSEPATPVSKQQGTTETTAKRPCGRPKGSKNRNKADVVLTGILKQLQLMLMSILPQIKDSIQLRYFVLDGYFGHNNALQMTKQGGLHLISKLHTDATLHLEATTVQEGRGRPQIYVERFNPRQNDLKHLISTEINQNIRIKMYQMRLQHRKFTERLNVVCILKTNMTTKQQSHILLFSSDLALDTEKMIAYYSLRFQIEFNFRDSKQYWVAQNAMNVKEIPVNNAANLSMFMVSVIAKLTDTFQCDKIGYSVLDLKSQDRGLKYVDELLKGLPQKPEPIVYSTNH